MKDNDKKVVVTGGAGFIGSHLTSALIERGFDTHIVDNLATGKRECLRSEVVFHEADICDLKTIAPIFAGAECVFHTAALLT